MPRRSALAASKVTMTSGRRGYDCGGLSRSAPGRKRRILGTSKGWSPKEAMTRWPAGPARERSAWATASIDPSASPSGRTRSEEHTSELQSQFHLVCRLLLEKKKKTKNANKTFNTKKKNKKY